MVARNDDHPWGGCLALGPWWLLYSGAFGPTGEHRHHAAQIVVCSAPVTIGFESGPVTAEAIVIPADTAHRITEGPEHATILFVDGDTRGAVGLLAGAMPLTPPLLPDDSVALTYGDAAANMPGPASDRRGGLDRCRS